MNIEKGQQINKLEADQIIGRMDGGQRVGRGRKSQTCGGYDQEIIRAAIERSSENMEKED